VTLGLEWVVTRIHTLPVVGLRLLRDGQLLRTREEDDAAEREAGAAKRQAAETEREVEAAKRQAAETERDAAEARVRELEALLRARG